MGLRVIVTGFWRVIVGRSEDRTQGDHVRQSLAGQMGLGIAALALLCLGLAWLGLMLTREAQLRFDKSQRAAQIHAELVLLAHEKAQLRIWAYRALLGQPDPDAAGARDAHLARMGAQLARLQALDQAARALPRADAQADPEQATRQTTIAALAQALDGLAQETARLLQPGAQSDDPDLDALDRDLDAAEGPQLAPLMIAALSAETAALARERAQAETAMARGRAVSLSAGLLAVPGALGLALWLGLGLRHVLGRIDAGLAAYAQDATEYRLGRFRHREFDQLAQQFDRMADEIDRHRARERDARARLEAEVAHRTADLEHAIDALAASDEARTQLLADVSHGLRTPVTVIRGEAQIALRRPEDAAGLRAGLERIIEVTRQMAQLIEDLLVLAQGGCAEGLALSPRVVSLADAAEPARLLAERQGAVQRVRLVSDLPRAQPVWADPVRLAQVLGCLLENAIRYSHPGGTVTLRAFAQGAARICIEIADQGIGLRDADLAQLFGRGWRSEAARAHRPDGLGLGLAIARDLARAHGAELTLAPNPAGQGTCARLDWPVAEPLRDAVRPEAAPETLIPQKEVAGWRSC